MAKEYVEERDGGLFVAGTRVSLDSVVYAYLNGESPEGIADCFQALSMEQIFGALAYYEAKKEQVNSYLTEVRSRTEQLREQSRRDNADLYAKLAEAKRRAQVAG